MAKKNLKGKPAKKVVKPAKKATVKKVAPKKVVKSLKKVVAKKVAPKKIAKPIKKVIAKKIAPKKVAKPVKKALAKKIALKKVVKPAKKVVVKKNVVKKITPKKVIEPAKKIIAKKIIKQEPVKPVQKFVPTKPIVVAKLKVAETKKQATFAKKKHDHHLDLDEDNRTEEPMIVEYRTPSILKPMGPTPKPHINKDKRMRYSDAELKEFKQLILKKLAEAQKDFELLKSTLSHRDDHGTDDTSPTFKLLEDGSDVLSKEGTAHLAGRQEKFIQNLQNALIRIENKTYGICRVTGKLISKERLKSVPHATLAIEAKLEQSV